MSSALVAESLALPDRAAMSWRDHRLSVRYRKLDLRHPVLQLEQRHEAASLVLHLSPVLLQHRACRSLVADSSVLILIGADDRYLLKPLAPFVEELRFDLPHGAWIPDAVPPDHALALVTRQIAHGTPHLPLAAGHFLEIVRAARRRTDLEISEPLSSAVLRAAAVGAESALGLTAGPPRRSAIASRPSLVERAKLRIAERFSEPITAAEIARHLDCSIFHLSRRFRAVTGSTLRSYRTQLRLREAAVRLLDHGESDSLSDLARRVGYRTHSHFSAAFRGAFGETPSEVRRSATSPPI